MDFVLKLYILFNFMQKKTEDNMKTKNLLLFAMVIATIVACNPKN